MDDLNEVKYLLNNAFGVVFQKNMKLLKDSNDDAVNGDFESALDFYITSHSISLIKNLSLGIYFSVGSILNIRGIIEAKALLCMYKKGDINVDSQKLFLLQYKIIEYNNYKEVKNPENYVIDINLVKQEYAKVKEKYKEYINDEKELKKILKSQMPALLNPCFKFEKIIKKYLSDDELKMYKLCSQIIHPNDNLILKKELQLDNFYAYILSFIIDRYLLNDNYAINSTFTTYHNLIMGDKNSITYQIHKIILDQNVQLNRIAKTLEENIGANNYLSNCLLVLQNNLYDITMDHLLGLPEQCKLKWKPILEMFSTIYYLSQNIELRDNMYALFKIHSIVQLCNNLSQRCDLRSCYELYKKMYPNGCNFEIFNKLFCSTMGFTINEKGLRYNLNDICLKYAELFNKQTFNINVNGKIGEMKIDNDIMLNYYESQMLSHSNGYMYYANSGAWGNSTAILIEFDYCLIRFLDDLLKEYKFASIVENNKNYANIAIILDSSLRTIKKLVKQKNKLLSIPIEKIDLTKLF